MSLEPPSFDHDFKPGAIHFGRNCVDGLEQALTDRGLENALVVCGRNVGANEKVMNPVEDGIGDRLAGVFDETTPTKTFETVFAGIERAREVDADVVVAVGGGSSLDVCTGISALAEADRTLENVRTEVVETGTVTLPADSGQLLPCMKVPTTMAGADLTVAAGLVAETDDGPAEAVPVDDRLMPAALFYDPELYETTPTDVLVGSAINGFDKGIEAIYSRFANPVTDATAVRGLRYLRSSLPHLRDASDPAVMERAVTGIVLAQHGVSMPEAYKINVVHAFGHALRNQFGIQQGVAHAVVVPHVLRLVFEQGGGRPEVLAEGLVTGEEESTDTEAAVVEVVETVRDGLGLPARLRDVDGTSEAGLRAVAARTAADDFLAVGPPSFDPAVDEIEETLRDAW